MYCFSFFFFFQAEDGIRDVAVTGVQTCALPICGWTRGSTASPTSTRGWPSTTTRSPRGAAPVRSGPSSPPPASTSRPSSPPTAWRRDSSRSEEHTSELQSRLHLVCRLLLEKKKSLHPRLGPGT